MRQDWDLNMWYLGEGPNARGSKKEELLEEVVMQLFRPFSGAKYSLCPFAKLDEGYFSSSRTVWAPNEWQRAS